MSAKASPCSRCGAEFPAEGLFCPMCGAPRTRGGDDPLLGSVIADRYLLVERIGRGGSGVVYRAEHVTLRRAVAVKILHHQLSSDDLAVERFRREATTVAQIDNEHILEVSDFGRTADGRLFFAMELLPGETLAVRLGREGRLPVALAVDIVVQIGEGLIEAHAMGFVHRDLRPGNIFLTRRRGRDPFVKLLDFGLAKIVLPQGQAGAAAATQGTSFADPRYMSPEQARGQQVDRRVDVYALGLCAYEMLTGKPPFMGDVFDVLSQHIQAEPLPPRRLRPETPTHIEQAILRALAKRPEQRFLTMLRMLEAVQPGYFHLGSRPAPLTPSTPAPSPVAVAAPAVSPPTAARPAPAPAAVPSPPPATALSDLSSEPNGAGLVEEACDESGVTMGLARRERVNVEAAETAEVGLVPSEASRVRQLAGPGVGGETERVSPASLSGEAEVPRRSRLRGVLLAFLVALGLALVGFMLLCKRGSERPGRTTMAGPGVDAVDAGAGARAGAEGRGGPPDAGLTRVASAAGPIGVAGAAGTNQDAALRVSVHAGATVGATVASSAGTSAHAAAGVGVPAGPGATARMPPPGTSSGALPRRKGETMVRALPSGTTGRAAQEAGTAARPRDPIQAEFHVKLGREYLRRGSRERAAIAFALARDLDPRSADAVLGLAEVALESGRHAEAVGHARAALRLSPRRAAAHILLGDALLRQGKPRDAIAAYEKAVRLTPQDTVARVKLEVARKRLQGG